MAYFSLRLVVEGSRARAILNADRMLRLEAVLGLDHELGLQHVAAANPLVRAAGNLSYVWLHWPVLALALVVSYARDRHRYRRLRDTLFWSGLVGIVLFAVDPEAPPRFLPGHTGTVSEAARRLYLGFPLSWSNPYASFPSFHVGWTLVACITVASVVQGRVARAIALVPAAAVTVAVVTTGNHIVGDVLVGAAIAMVTWWLVGRQSPALRSGRRPCEPVGAASARAV